MWTKIQPRAYAAPGPHQRWIPVVMSLALAGAFLADVLLPESVAGGLLYLAVILVGLRGATARPLLLGTAAATVLASLRAVLLPPGLSTWVLVNHVLTLGALWTTAALILLHHRSRRDLFALHAQGRDYLDVAAVVMVELAADGRIRFLNRRGCELLGCSRSEAVGLDWYTHFVLEQDRASARETYRRMMAGEVAFQPYVEKRVLCRGGELRVMAWYGALLHDRAGRVVGVLRSGEDITARKRSEDALTDALRELSAFRDGLDQAAIVALTDRRGRITHVNEMFCRISGYATEELLGQDHRIINSGYHPREFFRDLWRTIGQGRVWQGEIRNRAKDGRIYWVDTTIVPFLDGEGKVSRFMAIRTDITTRKQTEVALREQAALARLGSMAAIVAHEVKNPLAGIRGALQIIGERTPAGSQHESIIGEVLSRIDALDRLVRELLVFARPRPLRRSPLHVRSLLQATADFVSRDEAMHGVRIEISGEDLPLLCDPEQLGQAFLNLLLNAAQSMDGRGTIRVSVSEADGSSCRIEIADEGPSVPPELQEKIFEPFFTTRHRGTGLGLPTARRVVEAHGGHLVLSCPPSGGTRVIVTLPRADRTVERGDACKHPCVEHRCPS